MSIIRVEQVIEEIAGKVEGEKLALLLEYHPEKIQLSGNSLKCFCPLHREQAFRSLLLDLKSRTYRCMMKKCVGFEGGSFIDLWAAHTGREPLDAALDLAERLELDIDVGSLRTLGAEMTARAREALDQGELDEARQAADQAVAFLPASIEVRKLSAQIYHASGETSRSRAELLRVVDLCVEAEDFAEAHTILKPFLKADAKNVELIERRAALARAEGDREALLDALMTLAERRGEEGDAEGQSEALNEAIAAGGEEPAVLERIAALYRKSSRAAEALEIYEKLAGLYQAREQWADLLPVLEHLESYEPENLELGERIANTLLHLDDHAKTAERFMALAGFHKRLGDADKGLELLGRLIDAQPDNRAALEKQAAWFAEAGRSGEAIAAYRSLASLARRAGEAAASTAYLAQAKSIDPEDYGLRLDLAELHLEQGREDEGIAELFELANLYLNESDPTEGFRILERIRELGPDNVARLVEIGRCLEAAGYDDRALEMHLERAGELKAAGKLEAALKLCEEARRLAPRDEKLLDLRIETCLELGRRDLAVEVCREMARLLQTAADFEEAERLLQRGIKIDRTETGVKTDLARLYELIGRVRDAVQLWIEVALFHRASEHAERAQNAAREALRLDPYNAEAKSLLAEALESDGRLDEALELWKGSIDSLLDQDPESPEALRLIERALGHAPDDAPLLGKAAKLKGRIGEPGEARAAFAAWLERLETDAKPETPIDAYAAAVERFPEEARWRGRLADLLIEAGRNDEAAPHLKRLLETRRENGDTGADYLRALELSVRIAPNDLDLKAEWADALAQNGEVDRSAEIYSEIARLYLARGDSEEGLNILQRSLEHRPDDTELMSRIAELLEQNGRGDEAFAMYERLAAINREARDHERNIAVLEKMLLLRPERHDLRCELAELYEARADIDNAVEQYYRLAQARIAETPKAKETLELCQRLKLLAPDFTAARELLVEAFVARGEPDFAKAELDQMGDLALESGELTRAEEIFKRVREIDPDDIGSGERLGKLYEARGQIDKALSAYRNVLEIYRKQGDVERVISVLQKLKGLNPDDLELRTDLARTMATDATYRHEVAGHWLEIVELAIAQGEDDRARAAAAEAEPHLAGRWDKRFHLARILSDIREDEDNAENWSKLAAEALDAGENRMACDAASEGLGYAPTGVEPRELRIEASRRLEDWDAAEADLRLLAEQAASEDLPARAERYYAQAIEIKPEDPELIGLLAEMQIKQNLTQDAVATLRHLCELFRKRGELDMAVQCAEQIVSVDAGAIDHRDRLASILVEAGESDRAMEIWREIAELHAERGEYEQATLRYEGILVHRPRNVEALRRVADLTRAHKGAPDARAHYERLLDVMTEDESVEAVEAEFRRLAELDPDDLTFAERFGRWLGSIDRIEAGVNELLRISRIYREERNDLSQSLRVIQIVRDLDPSNLDVIEAEAETLELLGDHAAAVRALRDLAEACRDAGRDEQAARAKARCADIQSEDIEAQVEAAETWESLDEIDKATHYYLRAIGLYDARDDAAPCVPLLKRIIKLNPSRLDLSEALAQAYEKTDNVEAAVGQWLELGECYEGHGKKERAVEIYGRAKTLAPAAMEPRRRLVRIAEQSGEKQEALDELRAMIELAREARDPEQCIALLRHILEIDPRDLECRLALIERFRELDREPELYDALCGLEEHYREAGDLTRAIETLDELCDLRPEELDLAERGFDLLVRMERSDEAAKRGAELAAAYFERRDPDRAEAMMARTIAIEPERASRRVELARMAHRLGHEDSAHRLCMKGCGDLLNKDNLAGCIELAEAGLKLFPDDIELRTELIQALKRGGENERAIDELLELARLHERADDDARAAAVYAGILEENPDHVAAHKAALELAMRGGDDDAASEHLIRLAEIHYVAGNLDESIASLERLLKLNPAAVEMRCRLAELYHESGDEARAREVWMSAADEIRDAGEAARSIEIYERMRSHFPDDAEILDRLVDVYWQAGDAAAYRSHALESAAARQAAGSLGDAIATLETLTERFPKEIEGWERLSEAYMQADEVMGAARCGRCLFELYRAERRLDKAKECLERTLAHCPGDVELLRQLGELCLRMKRRAEGVEHLNAAAQQLKADGRLDEALAIVEKILKIEPANLAVRVVAGDICEAMEDAAGAVRHFGLAARGHSERRDYARAIATFERLLKLDPALTEEREAYARALEREGRKAEACDQYIELIRNLPEEADHRQTIRYCRQILKEDPNHVQAHVYLYRVYEQTDKARLALKECEWLVEHYLEQGERDHAEEYIRRGLEIAPDEVELQRRLAELLLEERRMEEAAQTLAALASLARGRNDEAAVRWALEKACTASPTNLDFRRELAAAQERAGESEKARATRLEIVEVLLENSEMEEARRLAEEIVESAPDDNELRRKTALIFEKAGLPEVAAYHFTLMARSHLAAGRYEEVCDLTDHILSIKPRHVAARLCLLDALTAMKKTGQAAEQCREIYRLYLDEEDFENAERILDRLIDFTPMDPDPREWRVDLYKLTGQTEQLIDALRALADNRADRGDVHLAVKHLKELIALSPDDTRARFRYIDLYRQIGEETELYDDYRQLAAILRKTGRIVEAAEVYEQLIEQHPKKPECLREFIDFLFEQEQIHRGVDASRQLAAIHLDLGDTVEAGRVLDRALEKAPDDVELRYQLATLQLRTNRRGLAFETLQKLLTHFERENDRGRQIEILQQMLEIDEMNVDLRQELAGLYVGAGEVEKAKLQRSRLADQYLKRMLYDLAEREYRRILDLTPDDVEIWNKAIDTHLKIGSPVEVVPDLIALSNIHCAAGRLREAVDIYRRILDIEPENIEILEKYIEAYLQIGLEQDLVDDYLKLATLLSRTGDVEASMNIFQHLREIAPDDEHIEKRLRETAALFERMKNEGAAAPSNGPERDIARFAETPASEREDSQVQLEKAIHNYENILKLNPENPQVRSKLAELLHRTGRREEAEEHWKQAARDYLGRADFTASLRIYEDLLLRDPKNAELKEAHARALLQRDSVSAVDAALDHSEGA